MTLLWAGSPLCVCINIAGRISSAAGATSHKIVPYRIDKCLCFGRSFEELKQIAAENQVQTIESLQEHVQFGLNCMLCHPYVRRMLRTGQTVFEEIVTLEDEPPAS